MNEIKKKAKELGIKSYGQKKEDTLIKEIAELENKSLVLNIVSNGWCEELGTSYFKGKRVCNTIEEYNILKKFAR